jgi:hypothetical protein
VPGSVVDRRWIVAGVAAPLVAVLVVVATTVAGGDDDAADPSGGSSTTAPPEIDEAWNDDLGTALAPLNDVLVRLASGVDAWSEGERSDEELGRLLADVRPRLEAVGSEVAELGAHPSDELAHVLVSDMADLYLRAIDAHDLALRSGDDDLARQYDLLGRRLRILADRAFDRARERTNAPAEPSPGIRLTLPAEVPEWTRLELAAGPPLEPSDPNRDDELPLDREEERSSQGVADWTDALADLAPPASADVRAARSDADALGELARALVDAAESLRAEPVPDGDRGRADRVALGWLVRADAARAAQLAVLDRTEGGGDLAAALLELSDSPAFAPA